MKQHFIWIIMFLSGFQKIQSQNTSSLNSTKVSRSGGHSRSVRSAFIPRSGSVKQEEFSLDSGKIIVGVASYYHDKFEGRKTSNGEIFTQEKLTAASNLIPLGSWVRIVNPQNDRSVVVFINDRMHPKNKRLVDLSKAAAKHLGYLHFGLIRVQVELLGNTMPLMHKN